MRELITIKKGTQRACLYGLGVPGLLGPSPPAKSTKEVDLKENVERTDRMFRHQNAGQNHSNRC
jgi:hypothetical protein